MSNDPLDLIASWGSAAAAGHVGRDGRRRHAGAEQTIFAWASVTKIVTALAIWVAVEEGTVSWEDPAGPEGSTLRHLLAHASGLDPDRDAILARPGQRRIYSNRGIEVAAAHLADAAGMPFAAYAGEAVIGPLGMTSTVFDGSPASGARGTITDLLALAAELQQPTLIADQTWAEVTATAFPGLRGVLPGFGLQEHNDWGLGVEIRGHKEPHWTGASNSPATFGHFGRSGSMLWVDPVAGVALAALADRPFGAWATEAWPVLSDAVLTAR
ncbi:MAG TPA: serine hydrolase domain-containing protein [Acidimicrobiales bacterium]|jgi:CubicO group peptidase (beta-lactamase class C family)|nr:serine hydrolase domain-containing protein [Acidimicrobiales bacterium]